MQLDSHHRFAKDWDIMLIKMLHSCDAGDKSVLTYYPGDFGVEDPKNGYSKVAYHVMEMNSMRYY